MTTTVDRLDDFQRAADRRQRVVQFGEPEDRRGALLAQVVQIDGVEDQPRALRNIRSWERFERNMQIMRDFDEGIAKGFATLERDADHAARKFVLMAAGDLEG